MSIVSFILLFIIIFSVYHLTSFPSIPGGDSGELLAESCLLGTAHPPGYPIFTMLSHIVGKIPFYRIYIDYNNDIISNITFDNVWDMIKIDTDPTVGWKVNNLCCLLGALTATFIAITCSKILIYSKINMYQEKNYYNQFIFASSSIAAYLYAFSPLVWEYGATSAEVFALNNFLCTLLVYLTTHIYIITQQHKHDLIIQDKTHINVDNIYTSRHMYVLIGAFISGCCLSNQHASFFHLLVLIPFVLYITMDISFKISFFPLIVISALAGLLPYLYLYIASLSPTPGSWGDLSTFHGLFRHVIRAEYGTFRLGIKMGSETSMERVVLYLKHASNESFNLILPFSLIGLLYFIINKFIEIKKNNKEINYNEVIEDNKSTSSISNKKKGNKGNNKNELIKIETNINSINAFEKNDIFTKDAFPLVTCLAFTWFFYVFIWHFTLSNLPLNAPMPYLVHARFWMQPNIILCIFAGFGVNIFLSNIYKMINSQLVNNLMDYSLSLLVLLLILQDRYSIMDRSLDGWVMHRYGLQVMNSLPRNAVLLSHTDLDWNPIRYLQHCQHIRPDVTHLSFQTMPFPWFQKQQQHLYPNITFPPTDFNGVSTDRASEGNAKLVSRFLKANKNKDVFLDMQAVNEVSIGDGGKWLDMILVPWGTVYKIYHDIKLEDSGYLHKLSYKQLIKLENFFPKIDKKFISKYPDGSWEFAAASVYNDAHYQLGLVLLTYSIDMQRGANVQTLPLLVDRLHLATQLLTNTLNNVLEFKAISSPLSDLYKNTAVSWMRLQGLLTIASKFKVSIDAAMIDLPEIKKQLIDVNSFEKLVSEEGIENMLLNTEKILKGFINKFPNDRDIETFKQVLLQVNRVLIK